jgi:hypothetical protein
MYGMPMFEPPDAYLGTRSNQPVCTHGHNYILTSVKDNFGSGTLNVIPEERPVRPMRLLLDRHREFLQSICHLVEIGFSEHAG